MRCFRPPGSLVEHTLVRVGSQVRCLWMRQVVDAKRGFARVECLSACARLETPEFAVAVDGKSFAHLAQSVEHTLGKGEVAGSIPVVGTSFGCFSRPWRSDEHTSELQSLMRISYAVFC